MNRDIDTNYTAICSAQTIFSNDKGFFGELFEGVKDACTNQWIEKTFNSSLSDIDKLKILYNEPNVCDVLLGILEHVTPVYKKKDARFSQQRRKAGEQLMMTKDFQNALILLSHAVLRAPTKDHADQRIDAGLTLALAFWSRGAVLLELGNGHDSLNDLQCAIDNGLQQIKQQDEYYIRMAMAHALIGGESNKVNICLKLAEKFSVDSKRFNELKRKIENVKAVKQETKPTVLPALTAGQHPTLKNASSVVDIKTTSESGNYMIAKEFIHAGDTLIVETPIAACLLPKYYGSHCLHCCKRLVVAYGCPICCNVAFCSVKCRDEACSSYHRIECKFVELMIGSGMSILCFIALRIITRHNSPAEAIAYGRQIVAEMCANSTKRLPDDFLQRSVMSAFLLRILQKANYFGHRTSDSAYPNSDAEFQIGEILFGLLQVLQFNAHEIYESVGNAKHKFVGSKPLYIGVAIYKAAAYFNHNCYPAVVRYFVGTSIVLCASHPLEPNEIVAENYGPNFTKQTLRERQRNLKSRYWFDCQCICCTENWPTLDKLNNNARFRCTTANCKTIHNYPKNNGKNFVCKGCKKPVDLSISVKILRDAEELYRQGALSMENDDPCEAIKSFISGINLFYTVAIPPHRDTHIAQESLRACLSVDQ